jgi:hypothetical protein
LDAREKWEFSGILQMDGTGTSGAGARKKLDYRGKISLKKQRRLVCNHLFNVGRLTQHIKTYAD